MLKFILKRVQQNLVSLFSIGVLFYFVAGTLAVRGFWIYTATVIVYQIASLLIILPRYPSYAELARVRKKPRSDSKEWDRRLIRILMVATFLQYILAAVDIGRIHFSILPLWTTPIGILLYSSGTALNQWAMIHNPHFEREVRIQADRDHRVIAVGPYQYVRHPGYLGSVLGFFSYPLLFGSGLAFIGTSLCIAGKIVRTYREDQALNEELEGYQAYTLAVPHRLIPLVW
jgi:protein-S-isoprenylcysteine O-methyltransferase Ste14